MCFGSRTSPNLTASNLTPCSDADYVGDIRRHCTDIPSTELIIAFGMIDCEFCSSCVCPELGMDNAEGEGTTGINRTIQGELP
jgi:hypothetical protein